MAPKPSIPKVITASDTAPVFDETYANVPDQWGFVLYRTTYESDEKWQAAKEKLSEITRSDIEGLNDADHGRRRRSSETATIKFVENRDELAGLTSQQIRKVHNPGYVARPRIENDEDDEDDGGEPPKHRADNLCDHVCLMVDEAAMESILQHGQIGSTSPGYVIAIDVSTEDSDMATGDDDGGLKMVEWDGTMMVHVESIFGEFYCRTVGEETLNMGEVHPDMGEIWEFC